jgi:hypothetical protein
MKTKFVLLYLYYLLYEGVRYMFRHFLGHHQASYKKKQLKYLNCVVLIWIHILQTVFIIIANTS